jgi:hypothetical protein
MKKYELVTDSFIEVFGKKLYRIKAKINFGNILKGDLGGFIETEANLDQSGDAWVYGNARVYDNARVYGDAWVYGNAWVYDSARVYGDAWVYDNARVYGDAWVYGNAQVYGDARVSFGLLVEDIFKVFKLYISCSLNVFPNPKTKKYLLFKRVNKISEGVYASCYDSSFIYKDGETVSIDDPDMDRTVSCSSGIHVSTPYYWTEGNTLIAVEVHENDIITCQAGKLRCKKVEVIGEVK